MKRNYLAFDVHIFDARLLADEISVESALSVLEGYLENPAISINELLRDLLSVPHLLEFVISAQTDAASILLWTRTMELFPSDVNGFSSSTGKQLLERWSHQLWIHRNRLDSQERRDMEDARAKVMLAVSVLAALSSAFPASDSQSTDSNVNKRAYAGTDNAAQPLIGKPFYDLGIRVPRHRNEAEELGAHLIEEQKCHLRYFFNTLRHPRLVDELRNAYIPEQSYANLSTQQSRRLNASADLSSILEHMRPSAHFDGVDGFGPWRVIILSRAEGDLRTARNKVPKVFDIISRKLRELSNGYFTDDNQRRLNTTHEGVPLFKGRLTGKLCYIYQIDCIPKLDENGDEQVIKLFGIFTLSKLNMSLWNGVSHELAGRGKEYVKRCKLRKCDHVSIVVPERFDTSLGTPVFDASNTLSTGPSEQLEQQVYSMLVLNTYVTLSKPLMNSILADRDVAMLFDLSKEEQKIVDCASSCYVLGRSGTGKTTVILHKMLGIEHAWEHCRGALPRPRQLFVTKSRLLADNVENAFLRIYGSLSDPDDFNEIDSIVGSRRHQSRGLVDRDEEAFRSGELPQRFSDLTDEHFPLFLSYSQLSRMLEAEYEPHEPHIRLGLEKQTGTISYKQFLSSYWPHFPQHLTKGLDSALVYNEIIGVIEGSEETAVSRGGKPLDETFYLEMSDRIAGTFSRQRSVIYQLYLAYSRRKRERGEYDAADRSHELLRNFQERGLSGFKLDFIYVDEVQDNLLIDALVLRTICSNPHSGLLWAGDTAQTISDGCTFRFEDLKALLYRAERHLNPRLASYLKPAYLPLGTNHRSHEGIVRCARLVVELLVEHWPESIDQLAKERGEKDGPKPVFLRHWDECTLHGNDSRSRTVLFGAQQCVLVRSDRAREELKERAGDIGLILTIQECKGLEFNDVLLYNFFSDSSVPLPEWRLITNDLRQRTPGQSLCRELKFLYVAITRARLNIWMVDGSEKANPMRALWNDENAIHDGPVDISFAALATPSAPSEWARTAEKLFNEKQYERAAECYERALRPREKAVAIAYHLRDQAILTPSNGTMQAKAYETAARAFLQSAKENIEEKGTYFRISAECFVASGLIVEAAKVYEEAFEYTLSAQYYRRAGCFDEAVSVVKQHRMQIPRKTVDEIVDVARMFYFRSCDVAEIFKATNLFEEKQDGLDYLEQHGSSLVSAMNITKAMVLEEAGHVEHAVNVYFEEGRTLTAIQRITANSRNLQWAAESLLRYLWQNLSLGLDVHSASTIPKIAVDSLIHLLNQKNVHCLHEATQQEMLAFRGILLNDDKALIQLASNPVMLKHNAVAALLCLDYVFSKPVELRRCSTASISSKLRAFLRYVTSLRSFAFCKDISDDSNVQRLLQFEPTSDGSYLVRPNTLLHGHCKSTAESVGRSWKGNCLIIRGHRMNSLVKQALSNHLINRVTNENQDAHGALIHHDNVPCMIDGHHACQHPTCCECGAAYGLPVLIHLQQILIYHSTRGLLGRQAALDEKRYWLSRLYFVLRPAVAHSDILDIARDATVPEFEEGFACVNYWVRHVLRQNRSLEMSEGYLSGFSPMPLAANGSIVIPVLLNVDSIGRFIRPADRINVIHCLTSFLTNDRGHSLVDGVFFVRHILEYKIPIDICLLCNLLDNLCGSLVVERQYQERSSLHNVILPMSWLIWAVKWHRRNRNTVTNVLPIYFEPLEQLLEQIYSGVLDNNLRYNGQSLRQAAGGSTELRHTFIARICANLHFLGENLQYEWLQEDLLSTMRSIQKPKRLYHASYERYVTAATWKMLRMDHQSVCRRNGIVQLHEKGRQLREHTTILNVRTVEFTNLDELPALLGMKTSSSTGTDTSTQAAEPISIAMIVRPIAGRAADEKKLRAARIILRACRRYHLRRRGISSYRHTMRGHFFKEFQGQVRAMRWARSRYRLLYLGAVPHLLVCLEYMAQHLRPLAATKLRRVTQVDHIKLEEALRDLGVITGPYGKVTQLQEILGAKSEFHVRRDLVGLEQRVLEVRDLASRLPREAMKECDEDLRLATKMVIRRTIGITGIRTHRA